MVPIKHTIGYPTFCKQVQVNIHIPHLLNDGTCFCLCAMHGYKEKQRKQKPDSTIESWLISPAVPVRQAQIQASALRKCLTMIRNILADFEAPLTGKADGYY